MHIYDVNSSARDEQPDSQEEFTGNMKDSLKEKPEPEKEPDGQDEKQKPEYTTGDDSGKDEIPGDESEKGKDEIPGDESEKGKDELPGDESEKGTDEKSAPHELVDEEDHSPDKTDKEESYPQAEGEPVTGLPSDKEAADSGSSTDKKDKEPDRTAAKEDQSIPEKSEEESGEEKEVDYQKMEREELIHELDNLIKTGTFQDIKDDVEVIRINFYKRHKAEMEKKRKKFLIEGGNPEDFMPADDPLEGRFKELYGLFRKMKASFNREMEDQKVKNLEEKYKVIEELKELIDSSENINQDFQKFREIQKRWRSIGMVPQQKLKDLWNTYHHYVEVFYDHVKINKELRDLDLKKNLEAKLELCEKAEELLLEPSVVNAFKTLQKYHDQWRETGPVPRDQKDAIWERFREITQKINKKHQAHFEELKENQRKNLKAKVVLCEKAEVVNARPMETLKEAEKSAREMIELQKMWKTIGFAPKKDNNKIYQRFKKVCDEFFARKREFSSQNKEFLNENYQKKLDLCVQAEEIKESTDWKKTTDELIDLQKKWKEIGPVPRKHYDAIWKRFRSACDHFFNRKSKYFSNINEKYEENLRKKNELIEEIENYSLKDDVDENLSALKEFQRRWSEIGFVPIKQKEEVQRRYRSALDKHFESLRLDDHQKRLLKYRHKLEEVKQRPNASQKLGFDREKFMNKLKQLENDLVLWENNIGFFTSSKNAEPMIKEFREKIEKGKKQKELLEKKIRMIDELGY